MVRVECSVKRSLSSLLACIATLCFGWAGASAEDLPPLTDAYRDFGAQPYLLGDWAGLRPGVDEAVGNLSGGTRRTVQRWIHVQISSQIARQRRCS